MTGGRLTYEDLENLAKAAARAAAPVFQAQGWTWRGDGGVRARRIVGETPCPCRVRHLPAKVKGRG